MTDGGLDEVMERTRSQRAEAERQAQERQAAEEQKKRAAEQRRLDDCEKVSEAGRSFARRAKEAAIPFDDVRVRIGFREAGIFSKKMKPVYSSRRDRWVAEASYYTGGGVSHDGHTVRVPIEVLADGTVLVEGSEFAVSRKGYAPITADSVIDALGRYLVDKIG